MPAQPFNTSFTKKFHYEQIFYPRAEEYRYEDLLIWRFAGKKRDMKEAAYLLAAHMSDTALISRLLIKIEQESVPECNRLSWFIQGLISTFSSFADSDLTASKYYKTLLSTLDNYCDLINAFNSNTLQILLTKLYVLAHREDMENDDSPLYSEDVARIQDVFENYLNKIGEYYEYFQMLIHNESEEYSRITVTSKTAYYLTKLVSFTEEIMASIDAKCKLTQAWSNKMANREEQELYN